MLDRIVLVGILVVLGGALWSIWKVTRSEGEIQAELDGIVADRLRYEAEKDRPESRDIE